MNSVYKLLAAIILLCLPASAIAQFTIIDAMNSLPYSTLPFPENMGHQTSLTPINYPSSVIPDKLYKDIQCTQYTNATASTDTEPCVFIKWRTGLSGLSLCGVRCGGVTDFSTIVLVVTDGNGNIKDALEGEIVGIGICTKQFKITADNKVIVGSLHFPNSASISFDDFYSSTSPVSGYRVDTTYRINSQGKFVKESEQTYPTKNYTSAQLKECDIWDL